MSLKKNLVHNIILALVVVVLNLLIVLHWPWMINVSDKPEFLSSNKDTQEVKYQENHEYPGSGPFWTTGSGF